MQMQRSTLNIQHSIFLVEVAKDAEKSAGEKMRVIAMRLVVILLAAWGLAGVARLASGKSFGGLESGLAWAVAAASGLAALWSMWRFGGYDAADNAQLALAATVGQLLLTMLLAAAAVGLGWVGDGAAFVGWLLLFYWLALAVVVFHAVRRLRGRATAMKSDDIGTREETS